MKSLEYLLPICMGGGVLLTLAVVLARLFRRRAFVETQPRYRRLLAQLGLVHAEQFLSLSGTIVSGHPDRNVQRLTLEFEGERLPVYLKREHRVRTWVRLRNALAGFGFVSLSVREACLLDALRRESIGCAEWIATGEDNEGRAFLLLREVEDAVDVRTFLRDHAEAPRRHQLSCRLGALLAHLHRTGFDQPDLYAKHILVRLEDDALVLLDWQRSRRRLAIGWRQRVRNLAALNATLADDVATVGVRPLCLQAYLSEATDAQPRALRRVWRSVERETARLLRRRHIRETRQCPLPTEVQDWIALDGEALSITSSLRRLVSGSFDWLAARAATVAARTKADAPLASTRRRTSHLAGSPPLLATTGSPVGLAAALTRWPLPNNASPLSFCDCNVTAFRRRACWLWGSDTPIWDIWSRFC